MFSLICLFLIKTEKLNVLHINHLPPCVRQWSVCVCFLHSHKQHLEGGVSLTISQLGEMKLREDNYLPPGISCWQGLRTSTGQSQN